jgi:hypothetical protein
MPAAAMRVDALQPPTINQVIALARKRGAPPAVVAKRLHELQLLSDWQYRTLCMEIAAQSRLSGAEEAFDVREKSLLLQRVFASLRSRGVTKHKIASTVGIYPKDLDELVFGLAMVFLNDTGKSGHQIETLRPRLTVVASKK